MLPKKPINFDRTRRLLFILFNLALGFYLKGFLIQESCENNYEFMVGTSRYVCALMED